MEVDRNRTELAVDCIEQCISVFLGNSDEIETTFPNALTPFERDYVLTRISKLNGISWEILRRRELEFITLHKKAEDRVRFSLSNTSRESLTSLLKTRDCGSETKPKPPNSRKEPPGGLRHFFQHQAKESGEEHETINNVGCGNRLHINYPPLVPTERASDIFARQRQRLPIWKYKNQILDSVENNRVTIIMGETASGKSTQVPQFIMDHAAMNRKPTKIASCHPNRISAIAATARVAAERGERVGISVGYQARLESCRSPCSSVLIFTTSELFLRSLVPPTFPVLNHLTYAILDDIHLRTAASEFLLTCLLNLLPTYQFHLILLCGQMNVEHLRHYLLKHGVPDFQFINVTNEAIENPAIHHLSEIEEILESHKQRSGNVSVSRPPELESQEFQAPMDTQYRCKCCNLVRSGHLVNTLIHRYLFDGDNEAMDEFTDLVLRHEVDLNGMHQATGLDFIAAAALKGDTGAVRRLFLLGASVTRRLKNGYDVISLLKEFRQFELVKFMNFMFCNVPCPVQRVTDLITSVDLTLICQIIQFIHFSSPLHEQILVFLSSYDEIMALKDVLFNGNTDQLNPRSFIVCVLHVNIPCGDEKIIFEPPPELIRKIILTTDVADTVPINDIAHVIDSGYMEQKGSDVKNTVTGNKRVLISKSIANGRVRQNTYRLYDSNTFRKMSDNPPPEILQRSLQELCLFSSSLLKSHKVVVDFFGQFLNPPSAFSVNKAFQELIEIGAVDKSRKITPLGSYLLDFAVEPRFGKALIYASILRCLDPVLTIVAILSHRNPFRTPVNISDQVHIQRRKEELSKKTFSDHMTMLQAFLEWENECGSGSTTPSLKTNNISPGIFDMICAIRTDLLGQLRAFGFIRCRGPGNIRHLNSNSHNWSVVKAALIAALYPNTMTINQRTWSLRNSDVRRARFHPLSCVARDPFDPQQLPSVWTLYDEVQHASGLMFCSGCTLVSTFALLVFGGSPYTVPEMEDTGLNFTARSLEYCSYQVKLNDSIIIEGAKNDIDRVLKIRNKFQDLLQTQLKKPGTVTSPMEDKDLQTIALILTTEDRAAGLSQIDGIGQWPRYAGGSLLSVPCQGFTKSATAQNVDSDED